MISSSYRSAVKDGDMVLCRLNSPLVRECFKFLKAGRKAGILGRDVGQGLISTIKRLKAETITDLIHKLENWLNERTAKERAKRHPSEERLLALNDRYDCIMCFTEQQQTVQAVVGRIESIFSDSKDQAGIRLSSIHKSKGLESKRVFLLRLKKAPCPHPMAKTDWQKEQEMNLLYVATTRAIEELCYVTD